MLVEHGGAGGTVAWPIAERILATYFVRKTNPKGQPPPPIVPKKIKYDPSTDQEQPTRIPTRAMIKKQGERRKVAP